MTDYRRRNEYIEDMRFGEDWYEEPAQRPPPNLVCVDTALLRHLCFWAQYCCFSFDEHCRFLFRLSLSRNMAVCAKVNELIAYGQR